MYPQVARAISVWGRWSVYKSSYRRWTIVTSSKYSDIVANCVLRKEVIVLLVAGQERVKQVRSVGDLITYFTRSHRLHRFNVWMHLVFR